MTPFRHGDPPGDCRAPPREALQFIPLILQFVACAWPAIPVRHTLSHP